MIVKLLLNNQMNAFNASNAINHSSDTDSKKVMNLYEKCIAKPNIFLRLMLILHQIVL